ncbi:MAG: hypothetical protein KGH84_04750 [Paracoccaceae bacterium]|nr:hypothetical protein [Paracoccaceae bacterium]
MNSDLGRTGMAQSVLREICLALSALAATGARDAIDLRSLPLTLADRQELEAVLGRGDVSVALEAVGKSEIWETRFTGVWWLRHFGGDGRVAAEVIEVTPVPDILAAHRDDIGAAAARMAAELEEREHV